jgi:hypothetical protein
MQLLSTKVYNLKQYLFLTCLYLLHANLISDFLNLSKINGYRLSFYIPSTIILVKIPVELLLNNIRYFAFGKKRDPKLALVSINTFILLLIPLFHSQLHQFFLYGLRINQQLFYFYPVLYPVTSSMFATVFNVFVKTSVVTLDPTKQHLHMLAVCSLQSAHMFHLYIKNNHLLSRLGKIQ